MQLTFKTRPTGEQGKDGESEEGLEMKKTGNVTNVEKM
jgi:hypothetical protein